MNEPTHFRVRNWHEFQHYKDRSPPWIKLHFGLLASETWVMLDDASRLLAVVCMLAASRNDGLIPNNPAYLKRMAYLDATPDLAPLISCGFLEVPQANDSASLARASSAQADASPEQRRAEQKPIRRGNISGLGTDREASRRQGKANGYAQARDGEDGL